MGTQASNSACPSSPEVKTHTDSVLCAGEQTAHAIPSRPCFHSTDVVIHTKFSVSGQTLRATVGNDGWNVETYVIPDPTP